MTEQAVVFPAASAALMGVYTKAENNGDHSRPTIVFLNAGLLHRIGPNRLYVKMAREMARVGFSSLRFDLSGVGDSRPRTDGLPLRAAALRDVQDALDFLSATQVVSSFILIGLCSGADLAFRAAFTDKRVVGAVLVDGLPYRTPRSYVYDQILRLWRVIARGGWRKLLAGDRLRWHNLPRLLKKPARIPTVLGERDIPSKDEAESGLRDLTKRGVNLLIIYTEGRGYNYQRQFTDLFPSVSSDAVEVQYFTDAEHTFDLLENQDRLVRAVAKWTAKF